MSQNIMSVSGSGKDRWLEEPDAFEQAYVVKLKMDKVLFEQGTGHQKMVIFENKQYGRVLSLDDYCQTTEKDEFCYHEMITHVPIFAHGNCKKVLIIGGGDGGALEEVLKHESIEKAVMVELDESVTNLCSKYMQSIYKDAFTDVRCELIFQDGVKFVEETKEKFDVIIVDSTDPVGPGKVLYERPFFSACHACLNEGGIYVQQNASPFLEREYLRSSAEEMNNVFQDVSAYVAAVPSYYGGFMAVLWACDDISIRGHNAGVIRSRWKKEKNICEKTLYYTPEVHAAAFALPPYISNILNN